jgi:hypothetical protein
VVTAFAMPANAVLPACVDAAASVNSRCEQWARSFNDTGKAGATSHDAPGGFASNRAGTRLYVATTSRQGSAPAHISVAALSGTGGGTLWLTHPATSLETTAVTLTLSPDERTVVVAGTMKYLPNLNAAALTFWFTSAYAASNGHRLWSAVYRLGGEVNVPVAVRMSPRGDRVFVTGFSQYGGRARAYLQWVTIAYSARGTQLWLRRYDGRAGGQNVPVGLGLSANGDTVYVGGLSEHPQNTGVYSWDYGAIAYDARTGKPRWTTVVRDGSGLFAAGFAVSADGRAAYLTGTGTYGTAESPVSGVFTIALDTRNGRVSWRNRYQDPSGLPASGNVVAVTPRGDRVVVGAAVGRRATVVAGVLEPSVVTMTALALDARTGKQSWTSSYAPDPMYSASPTSIAVNPRDGTVYLAGIVGPPPLLAGYPVTVALTTAGKVAWTARYDVRDPGSAGVAAVGNPSVPVAVAVDAGGRHVFESWAFYPVATGATATECSVAKAQGVGQDCTATGQTDVVVAYGA